MVARRAVLAGGVAIAASAFIGRAMADDVVSDGVSKRAMQRAADRAKDFLARFGAPGLSVAYVRGGRPHYLAAFGLADLSDGTALRIDHRFRIASVSKPITSVAIWKLVEAGELKVTSRVFGADGLLPQFTLSVPAWRPRLEAITVDHLLTHSAGGWTNDSDDPMFRAPALSQAELIQLTLDTAPLTADPGTRYAYSNFGYCLLGRVIEAVTGQGYEQAVRDLVLTPSGAAAMVIGGNTLDERKPDEVVYKSPNDSAYAMNVRRMDSHGGWVATPRELVDFVLRVDGYKAVPDILSAGTIKRMIAPGPADRGYARGWSINPQHANRWHNGAMPGTASLLVRVAGGGHFAGLVNTRVRDPDINAALDTLLWDIQGDVNA